MNDKLYQLWGIIQKMDKLKDKNKKEIEKKFLEISRNMQGFRSYMNNTIANMKEYIDNMLMTNDD